MSCTEWERVQADRNAKYVAALAALNLLPRTGARMTCPSCHRTFWLTLPPKPPFGAADSITFSCATACGYFGDLISFDPVPYASIPEGYDTTSACSRCEIVFATDGVVVRRPCCAIENPRELMADAVSRIKQSLSKTPDRVELELTLGFLVSTFDGIMRSSLGIANDNARYLEAADLGHPHIDQMGALPESSSFQSLAGARQRLLPTGWDMAKVPTDWMALVRLFQKRHTVTHRLGIVDQEYLDKTADNAAVLGKRVPLDAAEVIAGSDDCQKLVDSFFGNFLS